MSRRILARLGIIALAGTIVSVGLVASLGALALEVDWQLPEPNDVGEPSMLVDRDGTALYRFAAEVQRTPLPLSHIAEPLQEAVVAVEDHRFYEHEGVDPFSVARAVVRNVTAGSIREGGSTLTQQYVKTAFTDADRTFARKAREAVLAMQLEKEEDKDTILESYLNQAYFGDGAYGAQAAAQSYFGVNASKLSLPQAATLAGLLTAPSDLSPRHHPERARTRRNLVLDRMADLDMITDAEHRTARRQRLAIADRDDEASAAPYYVERVRQQLLADPDIGSDRLYYGGLRITAGLDVDRHLELRRAITENLPPDESLDAGAAVVDPETGDVVAAYSGRDFNDSQVDLALRPSSGRPSGSTFKTFALTAALEDDWTLESTYRAPSRITIADWTVGGSGGCPSPCTLLRATMHSANTVFAQLARDVGGERVTEMSVRLGSRSRFEHPGVLSHVLGTGDVTPLDMASTFATLANDGVACPARLVTEVRAPDGSPIDPPDPRQPSEEERERWAARLDELGYDLDDDEDELGRCYRAVAPSVARAAVHALQGVVDRGTGTRAALDDWPVAGKTGTHDDGNGNSRAIWFTGTTPKLAMSVTFGGREGLTPLRGLPACGGGDCYGGQLTADLWREAAERLHAGMEPSEFGELLASERRNVEDEESTSEPESPSGSQPESPPERDRQREAAEPGDDDPSSRPDPPEPDPPSDPEGDNGRYDFQDDGSDEGRYGWQDDDADDDPGRGNGNGNGRGNDKDEKPGRGNANDNGNGNEDDPAVPVLPGES